LKLRVLSFPEVFNFKSLCKLCQNNLLQNIQNRLKIAEKSIDDWEKTEKEKGMAHMTQHIPARYPQHPSAIFEIENLKVKKIL
jgi:hypothetical protein